MAVLAAVASLAIGAPPVPPPPTPQMLANAKQIFDAGCAACHGVTGEGNGPVSFAVKPPPRNFTKDPFKAGESVAEVFGTITNGLPNTRMVGYPQLKDDDRWGLAYYVLSFRPKKK